MVKWRRIANQQKGGSPSPTGTAGQTNMNCPRYLRHILVVVGVLAGFALRYANLPNVTGDYYWYNSRWYAFIVENGYFAALAHNFADHNVPYLYLLTAMAALLPGLHSLVAIKTISMLFDVALAYFVYKCVEHKYHDSKSIVPILAGLATLLAPTVVLNSSAWGQWDSVYVTFLVACLYFLLAGRHAMALAAFALAFSFKLQAVFMAPLFLCLITRGRLRWGHLAWVPLVYLGTLAPAALAGRPWGDLLSIHYRQADVHTAWSMKFPNLYVWIPDIYYDWWPLGVVFGGCVVALLVAVVYKSTAHVTVELIVFLATYSVLVVPYMLPKMHDRYFFPADVIAIVLAFYLPRYWYVPVVIGIVSVLTYVHYLGHPYRYFGGDLPIIPLVPLELLAVVPAMLIVALSRELYMKLYPKSQTLAPASANPRITHTDNETHHGV